jgi:uncharacterized protein with NRDE domain
MLNEMQVVIVNGRDYYFARPTVDASLNPETNLLAGRDLIAGGTWCGMNVESGNYREMSLLIKRFWFHSLTVVSGAFAAITDFREAEVIRKQTSRGQIVRGVLIGQPVNVNE